MSKFIDRFTGIGQGGVRTNIRFYVLMLRAVPTMSKLFQGRYVNHSVMEIIRKRRKIGIQEAAVLVDGVSAQYALSIHAVSGKQSHESLFRLIQARRRASHLFKQAIGGVHFANEGAHCFECGFGLPDGDFDGFEFIQVIIGQDHGNLERDTGFWIEARHFHIEPNQWICLYIGHHLA